MTLRTPIQAPQPPHDAVPTAHLTIARIDYNLATRKAALLREYKKDEIMMRMDLPCEVIKRQPVS